MIIDKKKIPKDKSLNSCYRGTDKWVNSTEVIKFTTQNGGKETTDEIPGGSIVQRRIADWEKQIQSTLHNSLPGFNADSSSSEISISPQNSFEKNNDIQQHKKSQIPIRSSRHASLSSNSSSTSFSSSSNSISKIPVRSVEKMLASGIFRMSKTGRLAILDENHDFLKSISPERMRRSESFRNATRIDNLTDKELKSLDSFQKKAIALGKT